MGDEAVKKEDFEAQMNELETRLVQRFEQLLNQRDNTSPVEGSENGSRTHTQSSALGATAEEASSPTEDTQGRAKAIADSLRSVILPPELKLNEARGHSGIRKCDQVTANIIAKCAVFAETALKLIGTLSVEGVTEANLQDLHVLGQAQIEYLQDEYSTLFIQGTFASENVTKFYKNFNKGTSALLPRHRAALSTAVNILGPAGHCSQTQDSRNASRRGRSFGGGPFRGFRRSQNGSANRDVFQDSMNIRFAPRGRGNNGMSDAPNI